jgi:hypothetical protein
MKGSGKGFAAVTAAATRITINSAIVNRQSLSLGRPFSTGNIRFMQYHKMD